MESPGLRALLTDIVDYAGLFPPAALSLDEAIPNFARYRRSEKSWMLGRFVIPVTRLRELGPWSDLFADDPPFLFSVLGTGAATSEDFMSALGGDLSDIADFEARFPGRVQVVAMEVRFPSGLLDAPADSRSAFAAAVADRLGSNPIDLFFEVPIDERVDRLFPSLASAVGPLGFGLKMRTGGVEAAAFPSSAHLATAMAACRDAAVRFKATAGLHHPVRHFSTTVNTEMPGFLNLFGAAVLAEAHHLDASQIREILDEQDPNHFRFEDGFFRWRDRAVSVDEIVQTRSTRAVSFGSCSFDEPIEDLQQLGLL